MDKFSYFISTKNRVGSSYHEFQTGMKKNIHWEETSLLLSENIMAESKIGLLFLRIIPNYDYHGISVVDKKTWEILKNEAEKESIIIQDIIKELTPWAEKSIDEFGCFSILGL